MALETRLLERLRCPVTGQRLRETAEGDFLETEDGARRYPVRDGLPRLRLEDGQAREDRPGAKGCAAT